MANCMNIKHIAIYGKERLWKIRYNLYIKKQEESILDTKKVGVFLRQLRKEYGMTQEQLGEKIGVTNKTVSRWENGNYMPPVESLQILSDMYQVSINEILAGERVADDKFSEIAETNLTEALSDLENRNNKFHREMIIVMIITTVLAMAIIFMMHINSIKDIIIMIMVILLAAIANSLNIALSLAEIVERANKDKALDANTNK